MDNLTEQFQKMRHIVPDDDFTLSAKFSILATIKTDARPKLFAVPNFLTSSIIMATVILTAIVITNINPPSVSDSITSLVEMDTITASFEKDISITMGEIDAYAESAEKTAMALYEASSDAPAHINFSLIQSELDALNIILPKPESVNQFLE